MKDIRNKRRKAIVINSSERGSSELRIFQKVYTADSDHILYRRLKSDVKTMSKKMCRQEILADIEKYKEQWKGYKDIKDKAALAGKVYSNIKEFEEKYGTAGGRILEVLILKALRDSKVSLEGTLFFNRLVKLMYKHNKATTIIYKFPYTKLVTLEVMPLLIP
eukprot:TRINITY_DN1637_c0_g4_i2.p2 TRINITY_DN1637_c0_g4~~TRINITY_DN1637_c0_g4_i2.p2  ORF type:complete len:163 (+),score=54.28 TRINITY_DN1637_c0_g4_i2:1015-1503(+)